MIATIGEILTVVGKVAGVWFLASVLCVGVVVVLLRLSRPTEVPEPAPVVASGVGGGVPIIAGPDALVSEAEFARLEAWLAEQHREGSR